MIHGVEEVDGVGRVNESGAQMKSTASARPGVVSDDLVDDAETVVVEPTE